MKRSVIVLILLALVLIVVGLVLCILGGRIAAEDNMDLFALPPAEEEEVTAIGPSINRIVLLLRDADIRIIGGYAEQSVTLTGFEGLFHEVNSSGGTLTVTAYPSWSTAFRVATRGFDFNGLRFFTRPAAERTVRPTVTLALNGTGIRNYEILLEQGEVFAEDIVYAADYTIRVEQGKVTMRSITGISELDAEIEKGDFTLEILEQCGDLHIDTGHGNLTLTLPDRPERGYSLVAVGGTVNFFGADRGGTLAILPQQGSTLSARTGNGDITLIAGPGVQDTQETPTP